jgi:hypothetical protein
LQKRNWRVKCSSSRKARRAARGHTATASGTEEDEEARENVLAEWGKLAVAEARRAFYATNNKVNLTTRSYATCVKVSSKFEYRLRKAVDESLSGGS